MNLTQWTIDGQTYVSANEILARGIPLHPMIGMMSGVVVVPSADPIKLRDDPAMLCGEKIAVLYPPADYLIPREGLDAHIEMGRQSAGPKALPRVYKTYFILSQSGLLKIGKAYDPDSRLKSLQAGAGEELEMLAVLDENKEAELHKRFAAYRRRGEWFVHAAPG